jgi:hypothetical protein
MAEPSSSARDDIRNESIVERAGVTRRAALGVVAGALGTSLSACSMVTLKTQNIRFTVEDDQGHVLGSGVWQWQENVPMTALQELYRWDGEAFPIVHPTMGKMYVTKRGNSGWGGGLTPLCLRTSSWDSFRNLKRRAPP